MFPCSLCEGPKEDRSILGELRNEMDHAKAVIRSKWNPENLPKLARYATSKGAANFGASFYEPSFYAMDEVYKN